MPTTLMTPGVYIEEKNAFPGSAVAVATAVPVFIGYTEKAIRSGKSLVGKPTKISSFAEYVELFGGGYTQQFKVAPAATPGPDTFVVNGKDYAVEANANNTLYFYSAIRLFYLNGGADCYIYSVGTYGAIAPGAGLTIDASDILGDPTKNKASVFEVLEKEYEPTLVVIPDIIALGKAAYDVYVQVLLHCQKTQSRFGIFDVVQDSTKTTAEDIDDFRNGIGTTALNYGAAYYPWLKSSIVQPSEVDFTNLDASVDLTALLPEPDAQKVVANLKALKPEDVAASKTNIQQSLKASSPTYVAVLEEIRAKLNLLPPSAAMAGIYTLTDNTRGVWKAPANVSVAMVNAPSVNISGEQQQSLNVDVMAGKSVNVIRPFPGIGTLVWGGRTLDGNSQDWRYINVRRTLIMIEQSLKLATRAYVFEPNDAGTWVTVSSMINNFLFNLWKEGALAGAAPEQAYNVQIGLGATMTPNDILDGIMRISVKVAIVRPAEFIVITFQQQQQQS